MRSCAKKEGALTVSAVRPSVFLAPRRESAQKLGTLTDPAVRPGTFVAFRGPPAKKEGGLTDPAVRPGAFMAAAQHSYSASGSSPYSPSRAATIDFLP